MIGMRRSEKPQAPSDGCAHKSIGRGLGFPTCALLAALFVIPAQAATLACHVTYGGATKTVRAEHLAAVQTAYAVKAQAFGSYFLFRRLWSRNPGAA